ncbi:MAG: hypothetical protein IJQ00_04685 [Kiritimatiellae bacterium]|nr:hypothetical protein [Kiritimatiellia bacterium]
MAKIREISSCATGTFKKGVRIPRIYLASALALCAVGLASGAEIAWQPQNGSTDISLPANWGGVLPGNGDLKKFGNGNLSSDYTVKIPAATAANPYRDKAGLFIDGLNDGQTVTIDATGTSWLQMADEGQAWHANVPVRVRTWDHIFDVDNAHAPSAAVNHFGFSFTDGTITFKRDLTNGSELIFNGSFNNAVAPDGTVGNHRTVLFHDTNSASENTKIIFRGGESLLRNIQFRGKTVGNEFRVDGGHLHVRDGLTIKDDSTGYDSDAYMHVTDNGQVTIDNYCLWIGHNASGRGVLRIDGNGQFNMVSGTTIYFPDHSTYSGVLSVGGNGIWNSPAYMSFGHNGGRADILVEGNGTFDHSGQFLFGSGNGCTATFTMKDDAHAILPNVTMIRDVSADNTRTGVITLSDNAILDMKVAYGDWVNGAGGDLTVNMSGNARLRASRNDGNDWIQFGANNTSKITLNLTGGTIEKFGGGELVHFQVRSGAQSVYNFSGVNLDTQNFAIEGKADTSAPDAWHVVRQTDGTINIRQHGAGDGLDIRGGNGRNAMYLLEGGTLNVANMLRVGHNNVDASRQWRSVFRQTGGQANIGASVNMCDSATMAEFELLGGRTKLNCLRGWSQSVARNANGAWATALFDGGTIEPWANGYTIIYTMPELRLGAKGLTIDTLAYNNITIKAKFQNEAEGTQDEVDGLFVKTGTGTLKASMSETDALYVDRDLRSYHAFTRIDQGTLLLTDTADAAFGKNITVKGGATLSIEGTPTTLTVDTITLGDGHGFAVLKLDAGDTVIVEAVNGVTANCGAIDVPWKSTEGTHAVFTCKQGVLASELDKIAVHDGDATKDYAWTTAVDNDTGYTICSVIVAPKGTLTKTITYSSGAVTTNGTGKVSGIIAEETGTQSGELVLANTASVSVDANQTMTLNGPLVGTGAELKKTGSGKLVVDGSNPDFYGSFIADGGLLEVLTPAALGTNPIYFPLILGGGTFRYSGSDPLVFDAALRIAAPEHKRPVVIDNAGDVTFTSTEYVQGLFIKKGVGTLTLDLPTGTFAIGSGDNEENIGENGGQIDFPASGDTTTSATGLYGVNILEGTMKVIGQGIDKTILETRNTANVGGGYKGEVAAILDVENARVNWGAGSRHGCLCRDMPVGSPAPEIHLKNAYLWSDSPSIGRYSFDPNMTAKLLMTNSTFYGHYNAAIGGDMVAVMIDANHSKLYSNGQVGWTVQAKRLDADFYGSEALLGSIDPAGTGGSSGVFYFYDRTTGELKFRDGATLQTTRGVVMNGATLDMVFDGGRFEIIEHNTVRDSVSTWTENRGAGFKTTGAGLDLAICEGTAHAFNFPIYGDGKVVKTGAGTFELVSARAEGEKLLQYTGGTVVSNGTFVVDGSLVADGAKSFAAAEGGVLDLNGTELSGATLSGAGVVTNGTFATATITYDETDIPTFSDVAFSGKTTVDFGHTAENPLDRAAARAGLVVAHYTGAVPAGLSIRTTGTGIPMAHAKTRYENGDVVVTITRSGFSVIIK